MPLTPSPRTLAALAVLLLVALPTQAQSVRLTLLDHVVGTEILHNAPLPAGTEVFVVSKGDARPVRLRSGYGEVAGLLPTARRDRIAGREGQTEGAYQPTARSGRSYFVAARLPDGRIFQSYVKTADAGFQPGFDDVSTGRVSMGLASGAAAEALRASLPSAAPPPAAVPRAAPDRREPTPSVTPARTPATDSARLIAAPVDPLLADSLGAAYDTTFLDTSGALTPTSAPDDDSDLVADVGTARAPVWPWALGGLAIGAAVAALVLVPVQRRRLQRQREHLLRLVPDPEARAAADAERSAALGAERAADTARFDNTMAKIESLRAMLRQRDDEIRRLRGIPPAAPETGSSDDDA